MRFKSMPFLDQVPETGALDQLSHFAYYFFVTVEKSLIAYIIRFGMLCIVVSLMGYSPSYCPHETKVLSLVEAS